jgi:2-keto-4-pentenoate hydratase/2-oxohepta-3-ene-1,7-dioic acid hydratase in catechol pathway
MDKWSDHPASLSGGDPTVGDASHRRDHDRRSTAQVARTWREPLMRLARVRSQGAAGRLAVQRGDGFHAVDADMSSVLAGRTPEPESDALPDVSLMAPVEPGKIVCIGLNYMDHIRECGLDVPDEPLVFAKFPSSLAGPADPIRIPVELTARVDWEVELAVVIGRRARDVSREEALDHVFGFTVANDVSARDLQFSDGQWVRAKSIDSFCPVGPVVVTADEVGDPQALRLTTRVNGELVQDATTDLMVFDVATLISFCSRSFTLEPGDLLLTGTPWGCGEFMEPQRSLSTGDVVECGIDGIGVLRNPVLTRATL